MSATDLTDEVVSSTYKGILHAGGAEVPAGARSDVFDGAGNLLAIQIGRRGAGVHAFSLSASGLSASGISYPLRSGSNGDILTQTSTLSGGVAQLSLSAVKDVIGSAGGIVYTPEISQYTTDADATPGATIPNHIVAPQVDRGIVIGMRSRPISEIAAADGGLTRTSAVVSTGFISNVSVKGGLVTSVTFGGTGSSGGSVVARGVVCFNGSTGAAIYSNNLTVSRTGIGVYAITLDASIRDGTSNYAAMVGAIDSGSLITVSENAGSMDVRSIGIDTYTATSFIVRSIKRYNVDIIKLGVDDSNSIHRWSGEAADSSRITVVVY